MSNAELEHISFLAQINADRPEKLAELAGKKKEGVTMNFNLKPQSELERLVEARAGQLALEAEQKELDRKRKESVTYEQLYKDYRKAFPALFDDGAICDGGRIHFKFRDTAFSAFRGDKGYYMLQREGGAAKELASPPMPALVDFLTKEFSR
jgi:hypothetical protein